MYALNQISDAQVPERILALMCATMMDAFVPGSERTVACRTVTTLTTMFAENVANRSNLRSRLNFMEYKNMIGSAVKSMSAK